MRELVAETRLSVNDVVAPLFVREGVDRPQPISSLPGVVQHSLASLETEIADLIDLGVRGVVLFGVPLSKDPVGSGAFDPNGIVQVALRRLRERFYHCRNGRGICRSAWRCRRNYWNYWIRRHRIRIGIRS